MAELSVGINSHNFVVTRMTPRGRAVVESFARRFVQYGFNKGSGGRYVRAALKVFATATQDRQEFRFHIHQYKEFQEHLELNYLKEDLVKTVHNPIPTPREVELVVKEKWQTRDYQEPVIEYGVDDYFQKLVEIQTGKGKSYCAMRIASILGVRMVIVVKAQFMDKWVDDVHKTYEGLAVEDLMVIRGSSQLQALLMMAKAGELESKIVLISNKTIQNWLKLYERFRGDTLGMGYDCVPGDMYETLEAGFRLIDEVHMDFHLNFKMDLYTHLRKSLSLSATLIADDPFLAKMYEMTYPPNTRFSGLAYHKYIKAYAVFYSLRYPDRVRMTDPATGRYSHNYYERALLKQDILGSNYLNMMHKVVEDLYKVDYQPGDRCLILCASIDFCSTLTDFLRKKYPTLKVGRFVEDDPYENIMESDICVTTMGSGGTGHDIPMLTTVIMEISLKTSSGNIQGFGRLRDIPGRTTRFGYLVCQDSPKQMEYHQQKSGILDERALEYGSIHIPDPI